MTQNKLDISIFEFKDRAIFKKKPQNLDPDVGKIEIRGTKPKKIPLARTDETSFTVDQSRFKNNNESDPKYQEQSLQHKKQAS